jgi:hypothetical protein
MLWKRYIMQAFLRTSKKHRRFLEFTIEERINSVLKESYATLVLDITVGSKPFFAVGF